MSGIHQIDWPIWVVLIRISWFRPRLKRPASIIVVGRRHFWLFVLASGPPYILYTYLVHHVYTRCIYTTIYIFGGPLAMTKTRPPTTMASVAAAAVLAQQTIRMDPSNTQGWFLSCFCASHCIVLVVLLNPSFPILADHIVVAKYVM